jgi:hypothetical protein
MEFLTVVLKFVHMCVFLSLLSVGLSSYLFASGVIMLHYACFLLFLFSAFLIVMLVSSTIF